MKYLKEPAFWIGAAIVTLAVVALSKFTKSMQPAAIQTYTP